MASNGSLIVRVTTSRAELPVAGASVVVTTLSENGKHVLNALMETDENGLTKPISLPTPETPTQGKDPGGPIPYSTYSLWVEHPRYQVAVVEDFQVFPGVESVQSITLVPLAGSTPYRGVNAPISAEAQPL